MRCIPTKLSRPVQSPMQPSTGVCRPVVHVGCHRGDCPAQRGTFHSQQGQALYEYILALPIFALLLLFVGVFAWFWWNQSVAAVAIHDGVRAAAVYGGSPADGLAVVEERLYAPLGTVASASYDGHYDIAAFPQFRSVYGTIDKGTLVHIPFLNHSNPLLFRVRAFSFQRDWAFYGGPGNGWD